MHIRHLPIEQIRAYPDNAKAHPAGQVKKIAAAITEFKWDQPIVVDADLVIIKGHGRFLADAKPLVMIADPPYGIGLDHTWRDAAEANRLAPARKNRITNDDRFEWWEAFNIQPCPIAYVWHSALHGSEVKTSLEKANYEVRQQIIWVKDIFALSRSAYQWKHEPCWYAVRKGATANWQGGRDKTTVWQAASPIMAFGGGRDDCRTIHPTQKPLDVIRPSIEHHTGKGEAVYDPFLGSGTTMVAAEQLGRLCYGLEIAPEYVAVILERLANMGLTPELLRVVE